jgi:hypothetical protein
MQIDAAHRLKPHGASASRGLGIVTAFSATLTRPSLDCTMSRPGSIPGMISVATSPVSVSRITQRSVT